MNHQETAIEHAERYLSRLRQIDVAREEDELRFDPNGFVEIRNIVDGRENRVRNGSESFQLCCPVCGYDWIHRQEAESIYHYYGDRVIGDNSIGDVFCFGYGGILIPYRCECENHLFFIALCDHKGNAFATTVRNIFPLPAAHIPDIVDVCVKSATSLEPPNESTFKGSIVRLAMENLTYLYGRKQVKTHNSVLASTILKHKLLKSYSCKETIPNV